MTSKEQILADDKVRAEIAKLVAETAKINKENQWYVAVITSGIILALVAIVKIFLQSDNTGKLFIGINRSTALKVLDRERYDDLLSMIGGLTKPRSLKQKARKLYIKRKNM